MTRREQILKYLTPNTPADELERFQRSFCIPNDPKWLGNFMGALYPLTQPEAWELDGIVTPEEAAAVFKQIYDDAFFAEGDCQDMACCPIRYGAGGVLQQQDPVTGEWDDVGAPPLGVRTPIEGQDTRCLAAANAVNVLVQTWEEVDRQFFTGATPYIALAAAVTLLALLIFYPPAFMTALTFMIEFYTLWSYIAGDDFDTDQQEQLQCILFCHSFEHEDGTVTFDYNAVLVEVADLWEPVSDYNIFTAIEYLLYIIGEDGLNRAGTTTAITEADCDICTECDWCYEWDFTAVSGATENWSQVIPYGVWEAGVGWKSVEGQGLILALTMTTHNITSIRWRNTAAENSSPIGAGTYGRLAGSNVFVESDGNPNGTNNHEWFGSTNLDEIWLNPYGGSDSNQVITWCRITGTGESPFPPDNC